MRLHLGGELGVRTGGALDPRAAERRRNRRQLVLRDERLSQICQCVAVSNDGCISEETNHSDPPRVPRRCGPGGRFCRTSFQWRLAVSDLRIAGRRLNLADVALDRIQLWRYVPPESITQRNYSVEAADFV
jgi:hypothetical protein